MVHRRRDHAGHAVLPGMITTLVRAQYTSI